MTKPSNSLPLVTVYMPTYNRVALLQRAVESVLGQDYRNIELIVVDDNSTDGTHQYLAEMAEKDSRFRYFINEVNSGACVSRNKAIFAANGEYITGLDDDDFFLPNRVSSFVKAWPFKAEGCIALYSNIYKKKASGVLKPYKKVKVCKSKDLIVSNWIGNQVFTKTRYLKNINGFDTSFPAWQDLECWYRLLNAYNQHASLVPEYSYVVDTTHPHERITTHKVSSIVTAYKLFCYTHELNEIERQILKLQLNPYTNDINSLKAIVASLKYLSNKDTTLLSLKRLINSLKAAINKDKFDV